MRAIAVTVVAFALLTFYFLPTLIALGRGHRAGPAEAGPERGPRSHGTSGVELPLALNDLAFASRTSRSRTASPGAA